MKFFWQKKHACPACRDLHKYNLPCKVCFSQTLSWRNHTHFRDENFDYFYGTFTPRTFSTFLNVFQAYMQKVYRASISDTLYVAYSTCLHLHRFGKLMPIWPNWANIIHVCSKYSKVGLQCFLFNSKAKELLQILDSSLIYCSILHIFSLNLQTVSRSELAKVC